MIYNLSPNVIVDFYSSSSNNFYFALILLLKIIHKIEKINDKTIINIPKTIIVTSNLSPSTIGLLVIIAS